MKVHEDDRRVLTDWNDDLATKTVKIVQAKKECVLGNHYHKIKTERFMLIKGQADMFRWEFDGEHAYTNYGARGPMTLNKPYIVKPEVRHSFWLQRGAILVCLVDKEYDPEDDYKD